MSQVSDTMEREKGPARIAPPGPRPIPGKGTDVDDATAARFWSNVDVRGPDDCWEWRGFRLSSGYGTFGYKNRNHRAHRVAWELCNGPLPQGDIYGTVVVMHACDNRACVNPGHLFRGSQRDNVHDMYAKGRSLIGEQRTQAKLTEVQVREIRRSTDSCTVLGARYGVSHQTIRYVRQRVTWAHVPEESAQAEDSG